ncbi:RING finger protein 32 [Channa argus]|uniref:RING finger protein 32 n=1 Tax=Channa argus TaxID=215402 RepID=A0A6G1QLY2_CHAAH|nr:RING finger protein 32 [Channa argus]
MAGAHAPLSSKPPKEVSSQVQQTHSPDSWHISEDPPFVRAQKLGLVASPAERLTEEEWSQVKARIQACWRGYVARKWYSHVKKTICPKDRQLRRKFFEAKLQELNDSFVRYCHTDMEAFLSDIDHSLSSSRQVFQQLERKSISEPQENDWDRIQSQPAFPMAG